MDSRVLLYSTGNHIQYPVISHNGKEYEKEYMCVCVTELLCCTAVINTLWFNYAAAAKSLQSCPTLCDPIDGSPPGSPVPGILQARTLEWLAISFSSAWKWKVKGKLLSRVRLFATPWTAAYQAPPSMGFSRQEYWSGVPLPSPVVQLYFDNKWSIKKKHWWSSG